MIPILALNLTEEQKDNIKSCTNYTKFKVVDSEQDLGDGFYVVVNGVTVGKDFLNLMLWANKTLNKDPQTAFIDSYTKITDKLPKKAGDKVYMRPWFSGYAYGGWKYKVDQIAKTEEDRKLIQVYLDKHGLIVVSPFVSRVTVGTEEPWSGDGGYKLVTSHGFHFQ